MKPEQLDRGFGRAARLIGFGGVVAFLVCVLTYFWVAYLSDWSESRSTDWGTFGDYVGGIAGTLIALFTLVAVILTLSLQETELRETRRLVRLQTDAMHRQQFETTFFKLLERFTKISERMWDEDVFVEFDRSMTDVTRVELAEDSDHFVWWSGAYRDKYNRFETFLGPYFRSFFHLVKFVDQQAELTPSEKAHYTSVARAQLPAAEVILQFVNAVLGTEGRKGLKPFVEKYGLLKHLKDGSLPKYCRRFAGDISKTAYLSSAEREAYWREHPEERPEDPLRL